MEFSNIITIYPDDLKVTLYLQDKHEENFLMIRKAAIHFCIKVHLTKSEMVF